MSFSTTPTPAGLPTAPDPLATMFQRGNYEAAKRFVTSEINGPKWAQAVRDARDPSTVYARALGAADSTIQTLLEIIDGLVAEIQTGHQS